MLRKGSILPIWPRQRRGSTNRVGWRSCQTPFIITVKTTRKEDPMSPAGAVTNTPAAHLELVLMDSRVAAMPDEHFLDRFRRRDLLQAEVLSRVALLLKETRVCGGKSIHLGKVVAEEWLQFIERTPEVASGLQLTAAVRVLAESVPFLAPLLVPLKAEVELQGYGEAFRGSGFDTHVYRQAGIYFKRLADILNLTRDMLTEASGGAIAGTFETPDLFALDYSENPFDLDDLSNMSPTTRAAAKFLVVLALAEGGFCEAEQAFLRRMLGDAGESLSPSQFQRLLSEASQEPLDKILSPVDHQSAVWKEKLLMSGMLMVAADGKADIIEKKLLAQACRCLEISSERYKQIAQDAIGLMKSYRMIAAQISASDTGSPKGKEALLPPVSSWEHTQTQTDVSMSPTAEDKFVCIPASPDEPVVMETVDIQQQQSSAPPPPPVEPPSAPERRPAISTAAPQPQQLWVCPACSMPQFQEFTECPQCGIIVEKYLERRGTSSSEPRSRVTFSQDQRSAPSPIPAEAAPVEPNRPSFCTHCGESLQPSDKFCCSCGNRVVPQDS